MRRNLHAICFAILLGSCASAAQAQVCAQAVSVLTPVAVNDVLTTSAIRDRGWDYQYVNVSPYMVSLIKPRAGRIAQLAETPVF